MESVEARKGLTVDRSRADVVEFSQGQPVAYGRNCGVIPATPWQQSASGPAVPRLRRPGRVSYHQASASWSPCRPAVPRCVVIVGKGPWSNEQRLPAVSSQAVRSGALSARHGAVLRYPWALGTCSPLVRVTFALLHPTCAPAPTLSVLALSWPRCDLHCARVCCVLRWPWCLSVHALVVVVVGWAPADPLPCPCCCVTRHPR